ncbi:MAG: acyl-CoA dehydrogenase [Nitrospinae bacterium]|nr:acyl-CoA dehydrogenase [Nitrospinota bacterium]
MDFELNETQRLIKETAAEFAQRRIVPVARENDEKERYPADIVAEMGELGMFGGPIPEEYGGAGLDYISYAIMNEEISKACSSVRTVLSVQLSLVATTILKWGSEAQKKKYLPRLCTAEWIGCFGLTEPDVGSDAQHLKTFAEKTSGGWKLNGQKIWISNGGVAQLAIVIAQTDRENPRKMAAFLVETDLPGFEARTMHGKLGLRSSNTAELFLANVEVPEDALMGEVGDGFKVAMSALDNGRYSVGAGCLGIAQGSLEASVAYAKERHTFGKPIAAHQLVQDMIARMVVDIDASRLLLYRAGELKNAGLPNTRETSIAKYYCSEAALRCANDAIQIHGGMGYSNEYPVERYMRDARVATIYEGTSQIQKLIIAGFETGIRAFA